MSNLVRLLMDVFSNHLPLLGSLTDFVPSLLAHSVQTDLASTDHPFILSPPDDVQDWKVQTTSSSSPLLMPCRLGKFRPPLSRVPDRLHPSPDRSGSWDLARRGKRGGLPTKKFSTMF
ncbi:MAG: hypothetical protein H8E82_00820 [Candidatus Marinimicrobia bacterium]|nr:hypothetical protein [Candidatus Neomarinimicrobiota bacterium]